MEEILKASLKEVKPGLDFDLNKRLVSDYGLESIDVIDLFFELQQRTSVEIDINELAVYIGGTNGRRFNDITLQDILNYIQEKNK